MSDKVQPETSAECSLRDRYAEGIGLHLQTDGVPPGECACGWKLSPDDPRQTWYALASHLADAVLAVRDDVLAEKDAEIERLREIDLRALAESIAKDATSPSEWRARGWRLQAALIDTIERRLDAALAPRPSAPEAPRTRDGEQVDGYLCRHGKVVSGDG